MNAPTDVIAVLRKASRSVPNEDFVAFDDAIFAVAELVEAAEQVKRAYWLARNSAAGLTNYCEDSGSTRRCERELAEAESIYHASGFDTALANIRSAS